MRLDRGPLVAAFALAVASTSSAARADQVDACIGAAEQSQRLRLDGRLAAARGQLLVCSRAECPAVVRSDCARWMLEVDAVLSSVVVRARDSTGAEVADVRVTIDGQPVAGELDGREIRVDPGVHVIQFTHADSAPVEQTIVLRPGEQRRLLSVAFAPRASGEGEARTRSAGSSAHGAPASRLTLWSIGAIGGGGAALGVASYFWISGLTTHSRLVSTCGPTHSCSPSSVDSAHGELVVGDVVAGAGIALAIAGAAMLVFGHRTAPPAPAATFQLVPGGGVLGLSGIL